MNEQDGKLQPPSTPAAGMSSCQAIHPGVTGGADNAAMSGLHDDDLNGQENPQPLDLPYTANRLHDQSPETASQDPSEMTFTRCPRKRGWSLVDTSTGHVVYARCKANACPYCGPINARLVAGAIGLALPTRALLLTQVGNDWQTRRNRMKQFVYFLKREGVDVNLAWHVEDNPKATGYHAHCWHYGRHKLPKFRMSEISRRVGMGQFVTANKVKTVPGKPLGYGLKLAGLGYGMKQTQAAETMDSYLKANGGRMVHTTRGFWRDQDGNPLSGQREAMTAWARQLGSDESSGPWLMVRDEDVSKALSGSGKS